MPTGSGHRRTTLPSALCLASGGVGAGAEPALIPAFRIMPSFAPAAIYEVAAKFIPKAYDQDYGYEEQAAL